MKRGSSSANHKSILLTINNLFQKTPSRHRQPSFFTICTPIYLITFRTKLNPVQPHQQLLKCGHHHILSMTTPWANWPLTLPKDKYSTEHQLYPEYLKINDQTTLTNMAVENRKRAHQAVRKAVQERLNIDPSNGVAIVLAGGVTEDWELYCSDTDKAVFRQEAFFRWLFGVNEPDLHGILDISGEAPHAALALPFIPKSASRWNGEQRSTDDYCQQYGFDAAFIVGGPNDPNNAAISAFLTERKIKTVVVLYGQNSDSGSMTKTTADSFYGVEQFNLDKTILYRELSLLRSIKTDLEIDYLRVCCNMSARAHCFVMANMYTCMTELQCEANFIAYCAVYGGSRAVAYTCICGSNERGSILHYGHAAHPNSGRLQDGDMIVLDMGAEYHGLATDLTRSYPVNGKFTQQQKDIFNLVRKTQLAVFDGIKPGVSWPELHKLSENVITEGLFELGVFQGDMSEAKANHISQLVYPHGLGHLLGHNVHCVGGYIDCPPKESTPGVCWLRLGRKLERNMVVTVEPGVYFNMSWIRDCLDANPQLKQFVNQDKLNEFARFGGVRLEDDVVVTENGYELLTGAWPSTVEEIEAVCATFKK